LKISIKLMAVITLAIMILLSIHGYLTVDREIGLFDRNMIHDSMLLGHSLTATLKDIWKTGDTDEVFRVIKDINKGEPGMSVRLVWLNNKDCAPNCPGLPESELQPLSEYQDMSIQTRDDNGSGYLYSYVPFQLPDHVPAAIEIKKSLQPKYDYVRETIIRKVVLFGAIVIIGGLLVLSYGFFLVGRPIQKLVEQARKVGTGDLSGTITIRQKGDEIAHLAGEMNLMLKQLQQSQKNLKNETERRISSIEQLHHAERLATVGKLASGIAHEVGTPLNVVSGRAKMIASGDLSADETNESAIIIHDQSEKITKIIRQLLDFTRRRTPQKDTLNIGELISRVLTVLKPIADQNKVSLHSDSPEEEIDVKVDSEQIQQVMTNLVINAIQSMDDGGKVEITASRNHCTAPDTIASSADNYLCIEVKDNGKGIPADKLERIFDPYYTTKKAGSGTGLGLSVVKEIIGDHGGWIDVESEVGKGSKFKVILPIEE